MANEKPLTEEKVKEKVASLMQSGDREALAALIVEYVQPTHIANDFIGLLMNTRRLNPGDALVKKVRKGIEVRTLVPGAVHLASEVTVSERMNYVLDGADVKVNYSEWDIENGDIGTVESIKSEMQAKLRDYFMNKVFTALTSIWTAVNTADNFTSLGTAITATALEDAIDRINQTTSGAKAVVGVRSAMTPITKFGAFWDDGGSTIVEVPSQIEEVMKTGMLGVYYGVPLISLNQQWDFPDDYNALLPTDKILVIGESVGEFITFGDVKEKQWVDMNPTPPMWNLEIYQQFGMIIDNAWGIYVIGGLV
jgi:hypothetical protein